MTKVPEITTVKVRRMRDERKSFVLIDVREPHDFRVLRALGSRLTP